MCESQTNRVSVTLSLTASCVAVTGEGVRGADRCRIGPLDLRYQYFSLHMQPHTYGFTAATLALQSTHTRAALYTHT